jgi:transcriptional regulator with XRE-family HTH domain
MKHKNINQRIGYKLRIAREENEFKQKDVAKQVNFSATHLAHIESGTRKAPLELLVLLTKIYRKDPLSFLADIVNDI